MKSGRKIRCLEAFAAREKRDTVEWVTENVDEEEKGGGKSFVIFACVQNTS